jgi:hypothetical protein
MLQKISGYQRNPRETNDIITISKSWINYYLVRYNLGDVEDVLLVSFPQIARIYAEGFKYAYLLT